MRKLLLTLISSLLLLSSVSTASARILTHVYGPTQSSDHLWQIAIKTRPNDFITPQQMMVALINRNPHAFKNHNVNGLYSGVYLHLPSLSEIRAISPSQAIVTISNQNKLWNNSALPTPGIVTKPVKPVATVKPAVTTKTTTSVAVIPAKTKQELLDLQRNVAMITDQFQQFMLVSNERNQALAENDDIMHKQLVAMSGTVQELSSQIENQRTTLNTLIQTNTQEHIAWQQQLEQYAMIGAVIGGCLLLLLALTWAKLLRNRQVQMVTENPSQDGASVSDDDKDLEDEYDFINSAEGIPAKLDLARAYIDMDDIESAKDVLKEVIDRGNSLQVQQAKQLLSHIAMPVAL